MKTLLIAFAAILIGYKSNAQIETPVKWSYAAKKIAGSEYEVMIKANINPGWHIYSAYQKDGGPSKTEIVFNTKSLELSGKLKEPKPVTKFEKVYGIDVSYFEHEVIFSQRVRIKTIPMTITGSTNFMVCNDQKCLFPEPVAFRIPVK